MMVFDDDDEGLFVTDCHHSTVDALAAAKRWYEEAKIQRGQGQTSNAGQHGCNK